MVRIFINEQHSLLQEQEKLLKDTFKNEEFEFVKIPAEGYTLQQMQDIYMKLRKGYAVFVSPVPVLLGTVAGMAYMTEVAVYVFHNDNREKKELPNGRIIQTVAQTGWELVRVA